MNWTKEADALLLRLRAEGNSFAEIGKVLDTTKNACIGRHRRLLEWAALNEIPRIPLKSVETPRVAVCEIFPCSTEPVNFLGYDWTLVNKPKAKKPRVEKQPLIDLHPAFDPVAKLWFLDEPRVEAKSIQLLLAKLPKGSTIRDYYKIENKKAA